MSDRCYVVPVYQFDGRIFDTVKYDISSFNIYRFHVIEGNGVPSAAVIDVNRLRNMMNFKMYDFVNLKQQPDGRVIVDLSGNVMEKFVSSLRDVDFHAKDGILSVTFSGM